MMIMMMMMTTTVVIVLMIVAVILIIIICKSHVSHVTSCYNIPLYAFIFPSFVLRANQMISSVVVLPAGCAVLHYMIDAQLFLRPQCVFHLESGCHIYLLVRNIRAYLYLKREGLQ